MNTHTYKCADVYTHMQRFIPLEPKEVRARIPQYSTGQELVLKETSCICLCLDICHNPLLLGPQVSFYVWLERVVLNRNPI